MRGLGAGFGIAECLLLFSAGPDPIRLQAPPRALRRRVGFTPVARCPPGRAARGGSAAASRPLAVQIESESSSPARGPARPALHRRRRRRSRASPSNRRPGGGRRSGVRRRRTGGAGRSPSPPSRDRRGRAPSTRAAASAQAIPDAIRQLGRLDKRHRSKADQVGALGGLAGRDPAAWRAYSTIARAGGDGAGDILAEAPSQTQPLLGAPAAGGRPGPGYGRWPAASGPSRPGRETRSA